MAIIDANEVLNVLEDSGVSSGSLLEDISYTISEFSISGEGGPFVLGDDYLVTGKGVINISGDGSYTFEPVGNWFGSFPVISYVVTDGIDTGSSTLTINVTGVSDAPVGSNVSIFVLEDSDYVFSVGDFGITDIDGDELASIKVKSLPGKGSLKYNGVNVVIDQVISVENLGGLKYRPAQDEYGVPYTTFTFEVTDDGSSANGGVITGVSVYTVTINVISVNDEPSEAEAGWVDGDFERILLALEIGISEYTINEMRVCANRLAQISNTMVNRVRGLLDDYDAAAVIQKGLGVNSDAGRTLVKADVLEWQVERGGQYEAVIKEKGRIYNELVKIFSYCPIVVNDVGRYSTSLIRS